MTLRPFVSAALVYAFVQSVMAASADSSWFDGLCDGLFDAPVGESTADRLERPPEDFRNRVVDHELVRIAHAYEAVCFVEQNTDRECRDGATPVSVYNTHYTYWRTFFFAPKSKSLKHVTKFSIGTVFVFRF